MAIIDSNLVFTDGTVHGSGHSRAVGLTAFSRPGRMEPIPLRVCVTADYDPLQVAEMTLVMQQAASADAPESGTGAWADVPGAALLVGGGALRAGTRLPWRFLPEGVSLPWMRLRFEVVAQAGKTVTAGALFAALMREEDFPYTVDQKVK